jgi:hypothetical protein
MGGPTKMGQIDPHKHWLERNWVTDGNPCGTYINPPSNVWMQCD